MSLAKGLGGGFPIGAMLATNAVCCGIPAWKSREHFWRKSPWLCRCHSHPGNPSRDGFILDQCRRMGEYFIEGLLQLKKEHPSVITDVRG